MVVHMVVQLKRVYVPERYVYAVQAASHMHKHILECTSICLCTKTTSYTFLDALDGLSRVGLLS